MTFNRLKTNSTKFAHYYPGSEVPEGFLDFGNLDPG